MCGFSDLSEELSQLTPTGPTARARACAVTQSGHGVCARSDRLTNGLLGHLVAVAYDALPRRGSGALCAQQLERITRYGIAAIEELNQSSRRFGISHQHRADQFAITHDQLPVTVASFFDDLHHFVALEFGFERAHRSDIDAR